MKLSTVTLCTLVFACLLGCIYAKVHSIHELDASTRKLLEDHPLSFLHQAFPHDPTSESHEFMDLSHPVRRNLLESYHPVLTASPSTINKNMEYVTIRWDEVENAGRDDFIAVYISPEADDDDFLDYFGIHRKASGSKSIPLTNIRVDAFEFRLFQKIEGGEEFARVARVQVNVANPNEPLQGRLGFADGIEEMRVHFVTNSSDMPIVQWGTRSGQYTYTATGNTSTYSYKDMCDRPAIWNQTQFSIHPGYMHNVLLTGLEPATRYYYRYGHGDGHMSHEASFVSMPRQGHSNVSFLAFGDFGPPNYPGALPTTNLMYNSINNTDFVLHFGDISYAMGRTYGWDLFLNMIEPVTSRLPYMLSIGNHDYCHNKGEENDPSREVTGGKSFKPEWGNYENDSGGECSVPVLHRFIAPRTGYGIYWYSFDYGNVHIIQMSTEHNFSVGTPQYKWLETDLKAVNRSVTPWIVLTGHRPMYNSERYKSDFKISHFIRRALEPLFKEYGVDAALWGHYHAYERTCRVYHKRCVQDSDYGAVHITVGSAGAELDMADYYDVEWSKFAQYEYGITRASTLGDVLRLDFLHSKDGTVADWVELKKKSDPALGSVVIDEKQKH